MEDSISLQGSSAALDAMEEAKKACLRAICTNLMREGAPSRTEIEDYVQFGGFDTPESAFIITVEDIEAGIKLLTKEDKSRRSSYLGTVMFILASEHHADKVIEEATLVSERTNNSVDVFNMCNNIVKRCSVQKIALDNMLLLIRDNTEFSISDISELDSKATDSFAAWVLNTDWVSEQPGITPKKAEEERHVIEEKKDEEEKSEGEEEESNKDEEETIEDEEEKSEDEEEKSEDEEEKSKDEEETSKDEEKTSEGEEEKSKDEEETSEDDEGKKEDLEDGNDSSSDYEASPTKARITKKSTRANISELHDGKRKNQLIDQDVIFEEERQKYEEISARFPNKKLGTGGLVAAHTNCLNLVLLQIETAFTDDSPNTEKVHSTTNNIINVLTTLSSIKEALSLKLEAKAYKEKATSISIHSGSTWGSIANSCEKAQSAKLHTLPNDTIAFLSRAKEAIAEVSNASMTDFVTIGHKTTNILTNLPNLSIGLSVCSTLALVNDLYSGITNADTTRDLVRRAKNLAFKIRPGKSFDANTKVYDYMKDILCPALASDKHEWEALAVAFDIRKYLTQTSGEARKVLITAYKSAQANKADGEINEGAVDYCGGDGKPYTCRRSRIVCLMFNLILQKNIQRRLPDGLFEYPMTRYLLCSAPSKVKNYCNIVLEFFDKEKYDTEANIYKNIKNHISQSYDIERGKRTVVIESQTQVGSLRNLLHVAEPDDSTDK